MGRYRRKENAGGTRSCPPCLRFVICRESVPILVCTQGVRGSNPLVSTTPHLERGFTIFPPPKIAEKAEAHPLTQAVGVSADQACGGMHRDHSWHLRVVAGAAD